MSVINGKRTETTEAVQIKNGKGVKEVVKRVNGKTRRSKKDLSSEEIQNVMDRKFMPGFFVPCHEGCDEALATVKAKKRLRKTKRRSKKGSK